VVEVRSAIRRSDFRLASQMTANITSAAIVSIVMAGFQVTRLSLMMKAPAGRVMRPGRRRHPIVLLLGLCLCLLRPGSHPDCADHSQSVMFDGLPVNGDRRCESVEPVEDRLGGWMM
jgi:hypothetical protein